MLSAKQYNYSVYLIITKPFYQIHYDTSTFYLISYINNFKGCGMGALLVLVFPCFKENVVVTCKIGSFLCSLDNFLQKNIIFFFENQISKWHSFEKKRAIFLPTFHIFKLPGKSYKNSFSTYLTHIHTCILLTPLTLLPYKVWKNTNLSGTVSH